MIAKRFRWKTIAIDDHEGFEPSFLDGRNVQTKHHYKSPPNVHSFVELYKNIPPIEQPFGLLYLASMRIADQLTPYFDQIVEDTIIVGELQDVQNLGEAANLHYRPLLYHEEQVAVRVVSP